MTIGNKTAIVTGASQGIGAALVEEFLKRDYRVVGNSAPPEPFGTYAEAVQTGNLLFLTGMLPTEGRRAKFIGRVGAEFDVEAGNKAARVAALNGLAAARKHLGSLDRVKRIVRLGFSGDFGRRPRSSESRGWRVGAAARRIWKRRKPCRLVYGVASLPLGTPIELDIIFEVAG